MVGLSGGEIFHEMMLRIGVKHVCESFSNALEHHEASRLIGKSQSVTLVVRFFPFSMLSTTRSISTSSSPSMNKVPVTWQKVMPVLQESPVLCL